MRKSYFEVEITETLQRRIKVPKTKIISREQDAVDYVNKEYQKGQIILDSDDFVGYEISTVESDDEE